MKDLSKDEVIAMAREAGIEVRLHYDEEGIVPHILEKYAILCRADLGTKVSSLAGENRLLENDLGQMRDLLDEVQRERVDLVAENKRLAKENHDLEVHVGSLLVERSEAFFKVLEERDALKADAERWNYYRDKAGPDAPNPFWCLRIVEGEVDRLADAAMKRGEA